METIKEIIAAGVTVVIAALFINVIVNAIRSLINKKKTPTVSGTAVLKRKSSETGQGEFKNEGIRLGKTVYTLTFEKDGEEHEFYVAKGEYDSFEEGTEGILYYRGKDFLGFTPDGLIRSDDSENA